MVIKYTSKNSLKLFTFASALLASLLTYINGLIGFKWDEHYLAKGGYLISKGMVPHVDFLIPNGSIVYYFQSIGNVIFSDVGLAYPVAASILSFIGFVLIIYYLSKIAYISIRLFSIVFMIYLFTLFVPAGSLWYNSVAIFFGSLSLLQLIVFDFELSQAIEIKFFKKIAISICLFLAIVTKLDSGLLFFILVFLYSFGKFKKICLEILLMTLIFLFFYYAFYRYIFNVNIFDTINFGQEGFNSRINISTNFLMKFFERSFFSIWNIVVKINFITHFVFFLYKKNPSKKFEFLCFAQLFIFISSSLTLVTSGLGGGFVNSHYSLISFIILFLYLKRNKVPNNYFLRVEQLYVLVTLALLGIFCLKFIPKEPLVKSRYMTYFASRNTISFFDFFHEISKSFKSKKVIVYGAGGHLFMNSNVSLYSSVKALWHHNGVTTKKSDEEKMFKFFKRYMPDILVNFKDVDDCGAKSYSTIQNFGRFEKNVDALIKQQYVLVFKGKIQIVGTGGGCKAKHGYIYKRL